MTMHVTHSEKKEEERKKSKVRNVKCLGNSGGNINWMGKKIMAKGLQGLSKKNWTLVWGGVHANEKEMWI